MPKRPPTLTGTAGVYYVAYELAARGLHAAVTHGNAPAVDLLVANLDGAAALSLQVKTAAPAIRYRGKRGSKAPHHYEWEVGERSAGLNRPNLFFAFVDLRSMGDKRHDVFIVPSRVVFDNFAPHLAKSPKPTRVRWHPLLEHVAQSDKPRESAPDVAGSDLDALVDGNTAFAFDLYQALSEDEGNLFYSPYSISQALAMTWAGARGETEQQMADTMRFLLGQDRLHPAFNALDLELASRGEGAEGRDDEGFRLNIVNAIWGQQDYVFLEEFLDVLAENYGAGLRLMDFVNAPDLSRVAINDWVSEQTEARIEDLLPPGVIDALTRLVLTNAIYFNEDLTEDGDFHLLDGGEVRAPMMTQTESYGYADGEGFVALELPYDGSELSMVVLLPDTGRFEGFEAALDADVAVAIIDDIAYKQVALTLPKFEFESEMSLVNALAAMGMPVAFSGAADFSGMTGTRDLMIAEIIHKAFVAVDEAGTEAAAATAVIMRETSAPAQPIEVKVDRPFVFLIRDIETGAVLFVGRVMDPNA